MGDMFINNIQEDWQPPVKFKWEIEALADFLEEEEEKMGCRWVKSSSNPSDIFGMALIKLNQSIYYQRKGNLARIAEVMSPRYLPEFV